MNTVDVLKGAKALIETKGWTQGAYHRAEDGSDLSAAHGSEAACHCGWGACFAAAGVDFRWETVAYDAARNSREALDRVAGGHFPDFNDAPGRTVEEVLAVFDKAIAAEEAKVSA